MELTIQLSEDEVAAIQRLVELCKSDERDAACRLFLRGTGQRREWWVENELNLARFVGEADTRSFAIGIPQVLARGIAALNFGSDDHQLVIEEYAEARHQVGLRSNVGTLWAQDSSTEWPFDDERLEGDAPIEGSVVLRADSARCVIVAALGPRVISSGDGDNEARIPSTVIELDAEQNRLMIDVLWETVGTTLMSVTPERVTGRATRRVAPLDFQDALFLFDPHDEIEIVFFEDQIAPLLLRGGNWTVSMFTLKSGDVMRREQVESLIKEAFGSLAATPDSEGVYPLARHEVPVNAVLVRDDDTIVLQVYAVVVSDIDASPALMNELNDHNKNLNFVRVFHRDEQIVAQADLVATSLDQVELATAMLRTAKVASTIGPMIAAMYGGQAAPDPVEHRWSAYRTTVVSAEVAPGMVFDLNGAAAIEKWPFPGPVHVLTGWNPQGIETGEEEGQSVNAHIAADILRCDGRFVQGEGRSPDGDHAEPSLIAWNLTRHEACMMGLKARQDAIFEIDDTTVTLISCAGDREESWNRRAWH